VRNFVLLAMLPALFAWILAAKTRWNVVIIFTSVYLLSGLLFFNISSVTAKINPPEIIVQKQAAYKSLPVAATQIELAALQPNFKSFAANAPQAFSHVFLLPYPGQQPLKSLWPFSYELLFYMLLCVLLFFFRRKDADPVNRPILFFMLFFIFTIFLFIGYMVPNIGSLVRYRSLYFPYIISTLLCSIKWSKFEMFS
jgi:hypothetical protein